MTRQEEYLEKIAKINYNCFYSQGYATAGHNGPHGHLDTPVRNTSHYLIIYAYLYKKYRDEKYKKLCNKFFNYLLDYQSRSSSGAIQCMISNKFDYLNGLIGQGWVIEALIYYYEIFHDLNSLLLASKIFYSQKYDWNLHLWHRIELDGTDIGIDPISNHQVWFAACSYKLADYQKDMNLNNIIMDFLKNGRGRILNINSDGLLCHRVNVSHRRTIKEIIKKTVKKILSPISFLNPRKLDIRYIEYGYHIFDLYGLSILFNKYGDMPLFHSEEYKKAIEYARSIEFLDVKNRCINEKRMNVYYYSYNSPAFEWPYVAKINGFDCNRIINKLYDTQVKLMMDCETGVFSKNNPDINTWNARVYEIIRYIDNMYIQ